VKFKKTPDIILSENKLHDLIQSRTDNMPLGAKKPSISLMSSETDLSRNQAIQNQRNSFSRGFPLPFNVETLQAFGADSAILSEIFVL
jgi:hypothetical protein